MDTIVLSPQIKNQIIPWDGLWSVKPEIVSTNILIRHNNNKIIDEVKGGFIWTNEVNNYIEDKIIDGFVITSGKDVIKELGQMSKEEYDYYNEL